MTTPTSLVPRSELYENKNTAYLDKVACRFLMLLHLYILAFVENPMKALVHYQLLKCTSAKLSNLTVGFSVKYFLGCFFPTKIGTIWFKSPLWALALPGKGVPKLLLYDSKFF